MHIWWGQTTLVVLLPTTTHIPSFVTVAHTELWIFAFVVISQSEQICKWGIKYAHSVTTDHMGSTCLHTTHIPSFTKISYSVQGHRNCYGQYGIGCTTFQLKIKGKNQLLINLLYKFWSHFQKSACFRGRRGLCPLDPCWRYNPQTPF